MGTAASYWHQPNIDPILIHLWGPFQVRWYSLLYVGGFVVGRFFLQRLAREKRFLFTPEEMEQLVLNILIWVVVGSRVIYCFVYDPKALFDNPLYLFQVYRGGLSFHGGILGAIVAAVLFARKKGIPFWNIADAMAIATPVGLAMGRLGNFINGELFGRVSYVPWAMIFKEGGPEPRHPSQLYELILEGPVLLALLLFVKKRSVKNGVIGHTFLMGYAVIRFFVEFFRQPDAHLGYLALGLSMGQWLSLVMAVLVAVNAWFVLKAQTVPSDAQAPAKKKGKRH